MIITNCRLIDDNGAKLHTVELPHISSQPTYDAKGQWLLHGCIDMAHRIPKKAIATLSQTQKVFSQALEGGITTLCLSSDDDFSIDTAITMEYLELQTQALTLCHTAILADATRHNEHDKLSDNALLSGHGARGFRISSLSNSNTLLRAMQYSQLCQKPLFIRLANHSLESNGVIHESLLSSHLGLPSLPWVAETSELARIAELARYVGIKVYIEGISSENTLSLLEDYQDYLGALISIHHLALDEQACDGFNSYGKNFPPLRSSSDKKALIEGLKSGLIHAIYSGHRTHSDAAKDVAFESAPFGIASHSIYFPLVYSVLHNLGFTMAEIINYVSHRPATLCGLTYDNDYFLFNPDVATTPHLGEKSPYSHYDLQGTITATVVNGSFYEF